MITTSSLLFIGILAYAWAVDIEKCRPLAVNIAQDEGQLTNKDPSRKGEDYENQYIDMTHFLAKTKAQFAVTRASYNKDADGEEYKLFCSAKAYGAHCGPIIFSRDLVDIPKPEGPNGSYFGQKLAGTFKMVLEHWIYNLRDGIPVFARMTATLIDDRDLIFQVDKTTIQFFNFMTNQPITDIPEKVKDVFSKPFATHQLIYTNENKVAATVSITCEEDDAWAVYDMNIVNEHKQGTYGEEIEKTLRYLDKDLRGAGENKYEYQWVQPVSTVFLKQYLWVVPQV